MEMQFGGGLRVCRLIRGLAFLCGAMVTLWATAALFVDLRIAALRVPLAVLYAVSILALLWRTRALWTAFAGFGAVLLWWLSLTPSNSRNWQPDVAELPWAEISGDRVTLHNIRNAEYRTETDYVPHWEQKTVDLRDITGVDLFLTHWGAPLIAHAIGSFSFADGSHLAMSIEARKEVGEDYSAVRGFFRQYELIYLVAEERDVVRLRTNFRKGESVYLYRTQTTPADSRKLFTQYLRWMNETRTHPQWYNALTANCGSSVISYLVGSHIGGLSPWDWRNVLIGSADKMLYDLGDLTTGGRSFAELKRGALINPVAQSAGDSPEFSRRIREGKPGF
jgi:hypothetical protein